MTFLAVKIVKFAKVQVYFNQMKIVLAKITLVLA
jgi:hypothetical protein